MTLLIVTFVNKNGLVFVVKLSTWVYLWVIIFSEAPSVMLTLNKGHMFSEIVLYFMMPITLLFAHSDFMSKWTKSFPDLPERSWSLIRAGNRIIEMSGRALFSKTAEVSADRGLWDQSFATLLYSVQHAQLSSYDMCWLSDSCVVSMAAARWSGLQPSLLLLSQVQV